MSVNGNNLTWALVVATYNREHILPRCVRLAMAQTQPPTEVVIVDASPGWEKTRDEVMNSIAPKHPATKWQYVEAATRSTTSQRNQGIALARADVVFLIDDDSLMYPTCAARIMEVYEADVDRKVVGVNAIHTGVPPDRADDPEALAPSIHSGTKNYGFLASMARKVLKAEDVWVPYDEVFPEHRVPESLKRFNVERWLLAAGWGMTFRREVCLKEPFESVIIRYAAAEDSDMSYRATRHGIYLGARDALLCHVGSTGGRIPGYVVAALYGLNPLVLHRIHSTDPARSRRRSRSFLRRRVLLNAAKDVYYKRWTFPYARGTLLALSLLDKVFSQTEEELRRWYPGFQRELIDANTPPAT